MTLDELICKVACQDMLVRFCDALDGGGASPADFFTEDASMVIPTGETVRGDEILGVLAKRPTATIATRHIMTNVLIDPVAADRARAAATILVYRVPRQDPDVLPRALPSTPQAVGAWNLELAKSGQEWKISHYAATPILEPAKV